MFSFSYLALLCITYVLSESKFYKMKNISTRSYLSIDAFEDLDCAKMIGISYNYMYSCIFLLYGSFMTSFLKCMAPESSVYIE